MLERCRKCASQPPREVNILPSISHTEPLTGSIHLCWPWTKVSFSQGWMAAGTNSKLVSKNQCGERKTPLTGPPPPPAFMSSHDQHKRVACSHQKRHSSSVNQLQAYKLWVCRMLLQPPQEVEHVQMIHVFRDIPAPHVHAFLIQTIMMSIMFFSPIFILYDFPSQTARLQLTNCKVVVKLWAVGKSRAGHGYHVIMIWD